MGDDVPGSLVLLDGVRWHGAPVPGERSHALLAALALEPSRGVGDDRLVHEVWGDGSRPAAPTKALQVLVSRTRTQTDPGVVLRTGQGYRLGAVSVDFLVLRAHADAARAALDAGDPVRARDEARAALAVPLGAAGSAPPGPVEELRQVAGGEVDRSRTVLGRALSALGEHTEALGLLEPAAAVRPGDETVLEALLRSEAAVRGAPAALGRYERHRASVRAALGTDPGPDLQRLHAELLAQDRPVREGLLYDPSRLIGREDDVAALSAMIRTSRVTSILGAGGLGKTRLAHVMGRLAEQPVVHFVELAGVTAPDGVAVEVGSALGVRESVTTRRLQGAAERHDLHTRIVERIGGAPTLLVLDNCEHVVGAVADLVAVLVARTRQLKVLTTTRAPLGLASERVYMLPTLGRADAVELFRERATSARPGVRLDDERIGTLVDRLDRLPLAVELAAAKVRVMSVEEIERRLQNRFSLLRGGNREAPERHQTLLAVIDWSWNLLAEDERVALRRLSAFRDGFSLDAAAALVGDEDPLAVVTALVDQSLVTVHETEAVRYRLLETVREFGRMQLVDAGDDDLAEARLRAWAVGFAARAQQRLFTREQVRTMRDLLVEEGNLTDVLRRSLADDDVLTVVPVMSTLAGFWMVEGNHLKVVNVAGPVEDVVAEAPVPEAIEDALRVVLATVVSNTMVFSGAASQRSLTRLRALGPGTGSPYLRATVTVLLAVLQEEGGLAMDALEALVAHPDRAVARTAQQWVSLAWENLGNLDGALASARSALDLCDDAEGPWMRAMLTSQLAGLSMQIGQLEAGKTYAERALADMDSLGALDDTMQLKALLVVVDIQGGRLDEAEQQLADMAVEDRYQSALGGTMVMRCGAAELAIARGETARGLRLYREAVGALRQMSFPGLDVSLDLTPWVLYPESGALSAHARAGAHAESQVLRDDLVERALVLVGGEQAFPDYPVAGSVLYALALWELTDQRRPGGWEPAARLLVVADVFAYNRMLPSLSWASAAEVAERRCPGLLESYRTELGGRRAVELGDDARRLVAALS